MSRYTTSQHTFLNAAGATGAGTAMRVRDFRHIVVYVATDGGADAALTVLCRGSIGDSIANPDAEPGDWTAVQSVTNMHENIHMWDLENATGVDGDTGFVVATADDYRMFLVNVEGLEWVNFVVTARTQGEVTVVGKAYSNL